MEGINKLKFAMWDAISNIKPEYETFDEEMEITLEEPEEETIIVKRKMENILLKVPIWIDLFTL